MLVPQSARDVAWLALGEERFLTESLDQLFNENPFSGPDRRLATEIACGVMRRQNTLDLLIHRAAARAESQVEPALWSILRIGTYQLIFCEHIPPHAAVHETVELAKQVNLRWTGFVNGVLRGITRMMTDEIVETASASAVPLTDGYYRLMQQPVFADPAQQPTSYFGQAFSFPHWLVERWGRRFSVADLIAIGFASNTHPDTWLRVNLLRTTRDAFQQNLTAAGMNAVAGPLPESLRLEDSCRIEELPGFQEGEFAVQDITAMHAARLLAPTAGETVWDVCAAPGTKATHLAELMQNRGQISATEVNPRRLPKIVDSAKRLGLSIITALQIADDGHDMPNGPFDAILLDVPCSNTGVLAKRPEARWRLSQRGLNELTTLQLRLLRQVASRLKPGGRVLYSTCSIEAEENDGIVEQFLFRNADWECANRQRYLPSPLGDGGYQALLRRLR